MARESDFIQKLGQTNQSPYLIDVDRANGIYIFDKAGKAYMDMIAGVAVNNIGHNHPKIVKALKDQIDKHLHVMVYGEFIQDAQLNFAKNLTSLLPRNLNCVYTVNSGTEAIEAALKLAKRVTGRTELVSFRGSYHGSTHGSMSVSGNEIKKQAFRPLLPDIRFLQHNSITDLSEITSKTAGVIIETVQGDAGVRVPSQEFLIALRNRCTEVGALLIFDEIQCGMGRTGKLFAFEHFNIIPDILTLGKALGGGMPIGALVSSADNLSMFTHHPMLGHITTFGGHPVSCAAALAVIAEIEEQQLLSHVSDLGEWFKQQILKLELEQVVEVRGKGLWLAIKFDQDLAADFATAALQSGFLVNAVKPDAVRIAPPLNISQTELESFLNVLPAALLITT
jgi:acetylornithine/succinyldiaminopimelate/putrescine aminotransferase